VPEEAIEGHLVPSSEEFPFFFSGEPNVLDFGPGLQQCSVLRLPG
jgi:hypothetical protein